MSTTQSGPIQISDLMSTVGTSGRYQNVIIAICCFLILQNGMIFLTSGYNYAVAPYDQCSNSQQGVAQCTKYVCSLPVKERPQFMNPQVAELTTLGNQFGDYHCKKEFQISLGMGMLWIGALIGSVIFSMLADKWGRRKAILIAQLLGVSGLLITLLAPNLIVAQIGMLIVGASLTASFVIVLCILREVLDQEQIQKVTIASQLFYPIGAIVVVIAYAFLKDWKIIFLWLSLIPQLACLIFSYIYFQQTPQFLIKLAPVQQIMNSLQFIAEENNLVEQFLSNKKISLKALQDLKEQSILEESQESLLSHWTLCLIPSLRLKIICIFIMNFCISCFYFIPFLLVNKFGFNFYINGIMLAVSDIASFPLISFAVKYERKLVFYVTALVIFACSLTLLFIMEGQMCTSNCNSGEKIAELILFFVLLFSGAMLVEVTIIYMYELFPVQVTALGMAVSQNARCFSNIIMPSVLLLFSAIDFPTMAMLCLMVIVFVGAVCPLPETLGAEPPELIEQIDKFEGL